MPRPDELIDLIARTCDRLRLEYFVTGSIASMYYGEPRFTNDVDVVVELPSWNVEEFCSVFPVPQFYVDPISAREAVASGGQFNIIQVGPGMKADIMCFRDTPFDNSRMSRRKRVHITSDVEAYIAAPEDVILKKLLYFREGGSDKHLRDIASILKTKRAPIDTSYIDHWALRLGVTSEWQLVRQRVAGAPRFEG